MPVHELIQLRRIEYYTENLHVCLIIVSNLQELEPLDSNSTKTRTGACITQKDWRETQAEP